MSKQMKWRLVWLAVGALVLVIGLYYGLSTLAGNYVGNQGACRITLVDDQPLVDGAPVPDYIHVVNGWDWPISNQTAFRAAFRAAVMQLEQRLGKPPSLCIRNSAGWDILDAEWQLKKGYIRASIGSGNDSDNVYVVVIEKKGDLEGTTRPASMADVAEIFGR